MFATPNCILNTFKHVLTTIIRRGDEIVRVRRLRETRPQLARSTFETSTDRRASKKCLQAIVTVLISVSAAQFSIAGTTLKPYVGVRYDENSNVFAISDNMAAASNLVKDDSIVSYLAGIDSTFEWGRQKIVADLTGASVNFDRYRSELDHDEFGLNAAFQWQLTNQLDGVLGYVQQRRLASFADKNSTRLSIENSRTGSASLALKVTSSWRLEPQVSYYDLESPQTNVADFGLTEKMGGFGIKYIGYSHLSFGLEGQYVQGRFRGTQIIVDANNIPTATDINSIAPPYTQKRAQLAASYNVNGLSFFSGAIGYTARDPDFELADPAGNAANNIHATTGQLEYQLEVTGKSTIVFRVSRGVNNYITAGGSEIDTGGAVNTIYRATGLTSIQLQYQYTRSDFAGELLPGSVSSGREDKLQNFELNITYDVLRWLSIRPFMRYQKRESNIDQFQFNGTELGVEIRAFRP